MLYTDLGIAKDKDAKKQNEEPAERPQPETESNGRHID